RSARQDPVPGFRCSARRSAPPSTAAPPSPCQLFLSLARLLLRRRMVVFRLGGFACFFKGLLLQVLDQTLKKLDQALPLRARAGAPLVLIRALVRDLVLEASHRSGVIVRVQLGDVLMGHDVPV